MCSLHTQVDENSSNLVCTLKLIMWLMHTQSQMWCIGYLLHASSMHIKHWLHTIESIECNQWKVCTKIIQGTFECIHWVIFCTQCVGFILLHSLDVFDAIKCTQFIGWILNGIVCPWHFLHTQMNTMNEFHYNDYIWCNSIHPMPFGAYHCSCIHWIHLMR